MLQTVLLALKLISMGGVSGRPGFARIVKLLVFAVSLLLNHAGYSDLPDHNSVPGGVAVVPLGINGDPKPTVLFGQKPVLVVAGSEQWNAIVGLSQDIIPGKYIITISNTEELQEKREFRVDPLPSSSEQRTITLPEKLRGLDISALSTEDRDNLSDGIAGNIVEGEPDFLFRQIVGEGSYIPYGRVLRAQDSEALIDHPWITYITTVEEIIRSPAAAIVDRIFLSENSGISVVLVHSSGMKSIINHIDETILKPGETINVGDVIGTVRTMEGLSVGRVDWFLLLNGSLIDPLQFTTST